jgi:phosphoribosylformimino-5-aminoimidazole carboxamide ribotide isomerase
VIEIIPAIDIIDGKCVRLAKGDYRTKKVYSEDPLDVARRFEDCGVKRLHVVDLDGARQGHIVNHHVLEKLATATSLRIDFGGGLKGDADIDIAFASGAKMVTGGSIAVKCPDIFLGWLERFGNDRIILGADARDGRIAVVGWQETTESEVVPFISDYVQKGIRTVICTDIGCDGMLQGPAIELYCRIQAAVSTVRLIASGGVGSVEDIRRLDEAGIPAVIVGKAIYEGKISLGELSRMLS